MAATGGKYSPSKNNNDSNQNVSVCAISNITIQIDALAVRDYLARNGGHSGKCEGNTGTGGATGPQGEQGPQG